MQPPSVGPVPGPVPDTRRCRWHRLLVRIVRFVLCCELENGVRASLDGNLIGFAFGFISSASSVTRTPKSSVFYDSKAKQPAFTCTHQPHTSTLLIPTTPHDSSQCAYGFTSIDGSIKSSWRLEAVASQPTLHSLTSVQRRCAALEHPMPPTKRHAPKHKQTDRASTKGWV